VVLAIAALGGNHAVKEMLLAQQQSTDQWAFHQAKVIREHLYRAQRMRLEALRDSFQAREPHFLVAEALLQIAIVMSSVSILARSGLIFSVSLVLGAALTANGYFVVLHLPFFDGGHQGPSPRPSPQRGEGAACYTPLRSGERAGREIRAAGDWAGSRRGSAAAGQR